jgi:hypothetical protein
MNILDSESVTSDCGRLEKSEREREKDLVFFKINKKDFHFTKLCIYSLSRTLEERKKKERERGGS